jgi:hypothetical protein
MINFRRARRVGAFIGAVAIVPLTAFVVAGPAMADYPSHVSHSDGCTLTNYYPRESDGKIIFSQKVVCTGKQNAFDLFFLAGWSTTSGQDPDQHHVEKKCLTEGGTSCSFTTSVTDPNCDCYYTPAVLDYISDPTYGVNGIIFQDLIQQFITTCPGFGPVRPKC